MSERERTEEGRKILAFPASLAEGHSTERSEQIENIVEELARNLRGSKERHALRDRLGVQDEAIEELLRCNEVRGRVAACVSAYLLEQWPRALNQFVAALEAKEGWAYRILLEAAGFAGMVHGSLYAAESEEQGPVISEAFERDVVRNVLSLLRGQTDDPPEHPTRP